MSKHSLSHSILEEQIRNKSSNYRHPSYVNEHRLLEAIRHGDTDAAIMYLDELNTYDRAILADHPLRSLKNNLISLCTLCARAAIQGGAVAETSFILSDILIRRIEDQVSVTKLEAFEYDLVNYFVELVQLSKHDTYSPPVNKAIRFIRENLQQRLTLKQIAEEAEVSPNYLSNLFSREVSEPPISYYNRERNNAIKGMLTDTNLSMGDIADTFNFSSVSYFSTAFRKENGMTPTQYRRQRTWVNHDDHGHESDSKLDIFRRAIEEFDDDAPSRRPTRARHRSVMAEPRQTPEEPTEDADLEDTLALERAIAADRAASDAAAGVSKIRQRRRPQAKADEAESETIEETPDDESSES